MKILASQTHRAKKAMCFLTLVLVALLLPAGISGVSEKRELLMDTYSVVTNEGPSLTTAHEALLFPLEEFDLLGVSSGGRLVGLASNASQPEVMMRIDKGMMQAGWEALPSAGEGLLSYVRTQKSFSEEADYSPSGSVKPTLPDTKELESVKYALVAVHEVEGACSIVVQLQ